MTPMIMFIDFKELSFHTAEMLTFVFFSGYL